MLLNDRKSYLFILGGIVAGFFNMSSLFGFALYGLLYVGSGLFLSTFIKDHHFPKSLSSPAFGGLFDELSVSS